MLLLCAGLLAALAAAGESAWAAGGAALGRRIVLGTASGALTGLLYALANTYLPALYGAAAGDGGLAAKSLWHIFLFAVAGVVGAVVAETRK